MPSTYFPATAKTKASFSYRDGSNRPIVFVGGVTVSDTKDRDNPPPPICGMDLSLTSLGNGHIMALQLGGPDHSANIVPQYQQWQQIGRWRQLEKDAMTHCAAGDWIFVAYLHYDNVCKCGKNHKEEFDKGNTTLFWDDPLIPTVFDIWLITAGGDVGKAIVKEILDPGLKDSDREAAAAKVPTSLAILPLFRKNSDQATQMPKEDLDYWRKNELAMTVEEMFFEYQTDREEQLKEADSLMKEHAIGEERERGEMLDVMMSPRRETEYEFVDGYGDTIRKELEAEGWAPSEVVEYGTNTKMLEAVFHKKTLSTAQTKSNTKRIAAYKAAQGQTLKTRDKFGRKVAPYQKMPAVFARGMKVDRHKSEGEKYEKRLQRFKDGMVVKKES